MAGLFLWYYLFNNWEKTLFHSSKILFIYSLFFTNPWRYIVIISLYLANNNCVVRWDHNDINIIKFINSFNSLIWLILGTKVNAKLRSILHNMALIKWSKHSYMSVEFFCVLVEAHKQIIEIYQSAYLIFDFS